ncbi:uncharacterized protein E6C27_scaffold853G00610 [Cucumis melo var. makuwa]|uniref:Senescence-specific cysteine protease sag39 n=1 Tax=Cucumis melo var. makuwa TaxID=1194695 RepID=A0A5A7ST88_CUCMM|nr:uncharacterized protein E6C27_scaffold853G00610 [Cucumis melo var. makuwa]
MSSANPSGKAQKDRLVELEEQMLYLVEVSTPSANWSLVLMKFSRKLIQSMHSSGCVAQMEGRVNELDSYQKTLLEMINDMSEDFRATLNVVRNEIPDVNTRLDLIMRAMANQVPVGEAIPVTKVKVPESKPLCGVKDAKALKNFIFDLK